MVRSREAYGPPAGSLHVLSRLTSIAVVFLLSTACLGADRAPLPWTPQTGDVVFHTSTSAQSLAVQQATNSKWSHVGVVVRGEEGWAVVEAVQPVRVVALREWLERGKDERYEVRRLANDVLDEAAQRALIEEARSFVGLDYDPLFGWSDKRIYCSELVWKAYERGLGIRLSEPRPLTDFDLSAPAVAELIAQRYPDGLPPGEVAVSPQDLADSPLLELVASR